VAGEGGVRGVRRRGRGQRGVLLGDAVAPRCEALGVWTLVKVPVVG